MLQTKNQFIQKTLDLIKLCKQEQEAKNKALFVTSGILLLKELEQKYPLPSAVQKTAEFGLVFYWYPNPNQPEVYFCFEIFEDGELVAAWSSGEKNDAWDISPINSDTVKKIWVEGWSSFNRELPHIQIPEILEISSPEKSF